MNQKCMLVILDGWGLNPDPRVSAIEAASTPFFDSLWASNPHATLITHGEEVGLPDGQMGNSEVGHLNIGAGRIIYQELARINKSIREGALARNETLLHALQNTSGTIHLMGLVSDGGVHSHIDHLIALAGICRSEYKGKICIHAFTDGRDVDPKSGLGFLTRLQQELGTLDIPVASVIGRYYAMDRDRRWERTRLAYDLLVHGKGLHVKDVVKAVQQSYEDGVSDEFIKPLVVVDDNQVPLGQIREGDTVLFFNFRTDRPRQITEVLSQKSHPEYEMHALPLRMITMTPYDSSFTGIQTLFPNADLSGTLGEYLSGLGKTQLRVAETEKYPHVTYFFSGGREDPFPGEDRLLIPSPKVATYDLQPEMSAKEVTDRTMTRISETQPDFICLNFANTDMVGHTGVFSAAVKAAETVDGCLARLIPFCQQYGYGILIIADHGNADIMINADGSPNTAHTKNPVPVIYVGDEANTFTLREGRLADIAPTLLYAMGLKIPPTMTGMVLLDKKIPG
jgi:2,3-bisphosphoglycerate-independent phosphoglycerate mutase